MLLNPYGEDAVNLAADLANRFYLRAQLSWQTVAAPPGSRWNAG